MRHRSSGFHQILMLRPRSWSVRGRSVRAMWAVGLALIAWLPFAATASAEPTPIVVFDFELIDTSLQGEMQGTSPAELERLDRITGIVRERFAASGRYRVLETTPAANEIARVGNLRTCNGCELEIGASLGAEAVLIGWVQKVSNLILNINAVVRDVATGRARAGGSVDIRGNTEESWTRGIEHLLEHQILAE